MSISLSDPVTLALIAGIFVLAGMVKGVIGMGLPTMAMGLLGLIMAPVSAAALLVVPSAVTNIWQFVAGPGSAAIFKRLATMVFAQACGVFLTGAWLVSGATSQVSIALGIVLILYVLSVVLSVPISVPPKREVYLSPLAGLISGLITGATGIMVIPAAPYLQSLGMDKESLVKALGLSFAVSTLALLAVLVMAGRFELTITGPVFVALLAVCLGMWGGQQLRQHLSQNRFRQIFLFSIACIGCMLIYRNLPL